MKDLQVPCIVCGEYITWDDSPLPAACATHTYQEVFEAYDNAAEQSVQRTAEPDAAENSLRVLGNIKKVDDGETRRR